MISQSTYSKGVISDFTLTNLTNEEWEKYQLENRIELTYGFSTWDLHSMRFESVEETMLNQSGNLREPRQQRGWYTLATVDSIPSYGLFTVINEE